MNRLYKKEGHLRRSLCSRLMHEQLILGCILNCPKTTVVDFCPSIRL